MALDYGVAKKLFDQGEFAQLIAAAGSSDTQQRQLEPSCRVVVANALALQGKHEEAVRLAEIDANDVSPAVRSQAESTFAIARWRSGDITSAVEHARTAVRFAHESGDSARVAWAHVQLLRLLIERGAVDAITVTLPHVRRFVAPAGLPQATAYLHTCVAVLEGQVGRLDEAERHLNIAESLLRLAPNSWLTSAVHLHRASVACVRCEFAACTPHLRTVKESTRRTGYQQHAISAETILGYIQLLTGQFERATETLSALVSNPGLPLIAKFSAADNLARVHVALGNLDHADDVLKSIEDHIVPEIASAYNARWAVITRARLLLKRGALDGALHRLSSLTEEAHRLGDLPLLSTAHLVMAQILAKQGRFAESGSCLLKADQLGVTTIREVQAQYYYGSAITMGACETPLKVHLRDRGVRVWADQGIVAVRMEMEDQPLDEHHPIRTGGAVATASLECVADSFAAFGDVAHRPRLLGDEMLWTIQALGCSPDAKLVETRENGQPPQASETTVVLPLGVDRKKHLTLVCRIPDEPVKAILLADVLRTGRYALELEKFREEERNRAALWPAPPIEEQAGALFIAEQMQTLLATARRIAPTTVPVLITGETGTGKEVLARTIHAYSTRASAAFLPFNCSSVPKDMLDSQLFGHRRGSFTGAAEHFPGVIRAAAGGTLFLDEIGETTLDVQPKLLRFLESNEVHPIGELQPVRADVRVIAATNADLDALVAQGRFREDLFYRLNIVRLHLPPLRERRVEIPSLAHHYLQKHAQEYRKGNLRLAEETMEYLVLYRWPGNVRQLANEMRRLAALAETDAVLMPEHLSAEIAASRRTVPASQRVLEPTEIVVRIDQPMTAAVQHVERAMIQHALRATGGRMEETAAMLGVSRKGLYLKRVRYGLEPPEEAPVAELA